MFGPEGSPSCPTLRPLPVPDREGHPFLEATITPFLCTALYVWCTNIFDTCELSPPNNPAK